VRRVPTRNLTILFTDLQGFTARTSSETRGGLASLLAEHERLLVPVFQHFKGTIVKTIGDAFLVTFESPTDAVICGLTIQEVLRRHNATAPENKRLQVRVSINVGEVEVKDGDVFGEPVNLAARLESITEAGEIYFTEAVYLTMNRREAPSTEIGERTFKGIPGTVRIYKVVQDAGSEQLQQIAQGVSVENGQVQFAQANPSTASPVSIPPRSTKAPKLAIGGAILGAAVVVGAVAFYPGIRERQLLRRADGLAQMGDRQSALKLLEERLADSPDDIAARDAAVKTAIAEADALEKEHGAKDAFDFLKGELATHPPLKPAESRLHQLDAKVTTAAAMEKHEYQMWDDVRELVRQKYPHDADVPFITASMLERRFIPEAVLWLYTMSFERGHATDPKVVETCTHILSDNLPGTSEVKEAFAALDKYFPGEKAKWADQAAREGTGMGLANAWPLLAADAPAKKDPFVKTLEAVMTEAELAGPAESLAAETDPARGRRAQRVIKDAQQRANLTDAQRDALRKAADALTARFGEPSEN
jgi:class 3 adenylate cyclase